MQIWHYLFVSSKISKNIIAASKLSHFWAIVYHWSHNWKNQLLTLVNSACVFKQALCKVQKSATISKNLFSILMCSAVSWAHSLTTAKIDYWLKKRCYELKKLMLSIFLTADSDSTLKIALETARPLSKHTEIALSWGSATKTMFQIGTFHCIRNQTSTMPNQ